jgi:putative flippase GtrA
VGSLIPQLKRFIIAGSCAVATDASSYRLLLHLAPMPLAKGASFVLGSCVAFVANKYWTFRSRDSNVREIPLFALLYGTTLGANVATNQAVLYLFPGAKIAGFLVATGVSTVLNFVGQRFLVFRAGIGESK